MPSDMRSRSSLRNTHFFLAKNIPAPRQTKKAPPNGRAFRSAICEILFRGVFFSQTRFVSGAFGVAVAVDEFDDRHRRHVTIAEASF